MPKDNKHHTKQTLGRISEIGFCVWGNGLQNLACVYVYIDIDIDIDIYTHMYTYSRGSCLPAACALIDFAKRAWRDIFKNTASACGHALFFCRAEVVIGTCRAPLYTE